MTMRTAYLIPALILAASSALAAEPVKQPTYEQLVAQSGRAHLKRLAACKTSLCRDRASTRMRNALARLDADRSVVQANARLAVVEQRKGR